MIDSQFSWISPILPLKLGGNDVHIWRAKLEQPYLRVQKLFRLLSEKELMRAESYRFDGDSERFIVGRGVLRTILGYYLGAEPSQIEFRYGIYGKPYLDKGGIEFNLAHSHELALYAFTRGRRVGLDIEYIRDIPNVIDIASSFFSESEKTMLKMLSEKQRREAFFNFWTCKEAYVKAIGDGLAHPLDQFEVSLVPGETAHLFKEEGNYKKASYWSMRSITPARGYRAALVVEGHNWNPNFFQFS